MLNNKTSLVVTPRSILTFFLILAGLYSVYRLWSLIILIFLAFLFTTAVNPLVNLIQKTSLPRGFCIFLTFTLVILFIVGTFATVIPPFLTQLSQLFNQVTLPDFIYQDINQYQLSDWQFIANQLSSVPKLFSLIFSAFSSIIGVVTFIAVSFYILLERPRLHFHLTKVFGKNYTETELERFVNQLEIQIGGWVRGELALMFAVGFMVYLGLTLMHLNYALPLALLAGLLEVVPNLGPTLAAIPAVLLALTTNSPSMAVAVVALYVLIQQLENQLLVPNIMKQAVGINPLAAIILTMASLELFGLVGAMLAIPIYLVVKVAFIEWRQLKRKPSFLPKLGNE